MNRDIVKILQEIRETDDPEQIHELISEALEIDSHDPMVLLLAAEFSSDAYERLSFLDHAIRHTEHHLAEENMFDAGNENDLLEHPLTDLLTKMVSLRFHSFMDLNYYHQAVHEYLQLQTLEANEAYDDERVMLACLFGNYLQLAQDLHEQYSIPPFTISYPYAVMLYNHGNEETGLAIFENLLQTIPKLKAFFTQLTFGETPTPESEEDYILLNTLLQISNFTPEAFTNIVGNSHN